MACNTALRLETWRAFHILITHHPQPNPRGLQNVRESVCWSLPKAVCFIRRLYSSPSFNRQPPAKGVYNVLEAGVYRGLARYAWLKMVRNQERLNCRSRNFDDNLRNIKTGHKGGEP